MSKQNFEKDLELLERQINCFNEIIKENKRQRKELEDYKEKVAKFISKIEELFFKCIDSGIDEELIKKDYYKYKQELGEQGK